MWISDPGSSFAVHYYFVNWARFVNIHHYSTCIVMSECLVSEIRISHDLLPISCECGTQPSKIGWVELHTQYQEMGCIHTNSSTQNCGVTPHCNIDCQKDLAKEERRERQNHVMTKVKHSSITYPYVQNLWLHYLCSSAKEKSSCKRLFPLLWCAYNLPSISQASNVILTLGLAATPW